MKKAEAPAPKWCTWEGSPIACTEKNKVMAENLEEIKGYLQDAIDDAVLMGCSEASFRVGRTRRFATCIPNTLSRKLGLEKKMTKFYKLILVCCAALFLTACAHPDMISL